VELFSEFRKWALKGVIKKGISRLKGGQGT